MKNNMTNITLGRGRYKPPMSDLVTIEIDGRRLRLPRQLFLNIATYAQRWTGLAKREETQAWAKQIGQDCEDLIDFSRVNGDYDPARRRVDILKTLRDSGIEEGDWRSDMLEKAKHLAEIVDTPPAETVH